MPRVLLVAPHSDLPGVDIDVEDVLTSGLEVDPLLGDVRAQDVTRRLRKGGYDALIVAGHGDAGGIGLGRQALSTATLTAAARTARVAVVYLNTCDSEQVGCRIASETAADCICWVGPADDEQAAHTMTLWATQYARSGDARAAYEAARPGGNANYLYLRGKPDMRQDDLRSVATMIDQLGRSLSDQMRDVGQRLGRVEGRVERVERRVDEVEDNMQIELGKIVACLPPLSWWRLLATVIGVALLIGPPLAYYWLHDGAGVPRGALVWGVFGVQSVCLPFFLYGAGYVRDPKVKL